MLDMSERASNKEFLHSIVENDFEIPQNIDYFTFATALLANFSSVDGELRDDLSYMILARGVIDRGLLKNEQLEKLLLLSLDKDHLFYQIGDMGKDSVFMRSFSNLIVAAILYTDASTPVLSEQAIRHAKDGLLRYARQEKDWRGYVEGKGWAHAMAHLADALDVCAQSPKLVQADREEIMRVVSDLAKLAVPLHHEEDMRLSAVAYRIIVCKQVTEEFISIWLESCFVPREHNVSSWRRLTNVKNFLRSLYFRLLWDNMALSVVEQIASLLKREDAIYIELPDGK